MKFRLVLPVIMLCMASASAYADESEGDRALTTARNLALTHPESQPLAESIQALANLGDRSGHTNRKIPSVDSLGGLGRKKESVAPNLAFAAAIPSIADSADTSDHALVPLFAVGRRLLQSVLSSSKVDLSQKDLEGHTLLEYLTLARQAAYSRFLKQNPKTADLQKIIFHLDEMKLLVSFVAEQQKQEAQTAALLAATDVSQLRSSIQNYVAKSQVSQLELRLVLEGLIKELPTQVFAPTESVQTSVMSTNEARIKVRVP